MRKLAPYLCFLAVALSGVVVGVVRPGSGSSVAARTGRSDSASTASLGGKSEADKSVIGSPPAVRLLREYFGLPELTLRPPEPVPAASDGADSPSPALLDHVRLLDEQLAQLNRPARISFLVALLSDPIESSADHFDPFLDAVQRAFEAEGYVIDRHYLPWADHLAGRGDNASPRYRREPGVILFRRLRRTPTAAAASAAGQAPAAQPLASEVVVVFVVGENPISGIHKPALAHALDFLAAWTVCDESWFSCTPPTVRILGPTYSGSAVSLRMALLSWLRTRRQNLVVEILSGSAMATDNKSLLTIDESLGPEGPALLASYYATFLNTNEVFDTFRDRYLRDRLHVRPGDIVLFREGNTSYGASVRSPAAAAAPQAGHHEEGVLTITYPLQIGRTRTAYEQQELLRLPTGAAGALRLFPGLDIRLEQNPRATDLPPAMSPTTAANVERVLIALLDAVNREDRRYIGLMGTNVEDRLFLRNSCITAARTCTCSASTITCSTRTPSTTVTWRECWSRRRSRFIHRTTTALGRCSAFPATR